MQPLIRQQWNKILGAFSRNQLSPKGEIYSYNTKWSIITMQ